MAVCPQCHGFDDYCADVAICETCKGSGSVSAKIRMARMNCNTGSFEGEHIFLDAEPVCMCGTTARTVPAWLVERQRQQQAEHGRDCDGGCSWDHCPKRSRHWQFEQAAKH